VLPMVVVTDHVSGRRGGGYLLFYAFNSSIASLPDVRTTDEDKNEASHKIWEASQKRKHGNLLSPMPLR
jgi:hypothetical protein